MIDDFQAHRNEERAYRDGKHDGMWEAKSKYQKMLRYIDELGLTPTTADIIELKTLAKEIEQNVTKR